jgi:hypothetical protein
MFRRAPVLSWCIFLLFLWLAHTLGYLVHEYAHSFCAWALGCKANPLALDYGHLRFQNVALLSDVDENVDYASIFRSGKDYLVAVVAVAGVLLGNGIFYLISRRLYSFAKVQDRPRLGLFAFLFCLMNVGNFLGYVPVRTFTWHADMANVEKALHISPWWICTVLGVPFAAAIWHLFARLLPDARSFIFREEAVPKTILSTVSAFTVFVFFGSSGLHGYGVASHWISVGSSCGLFPLALVLCWPRKVEQS